MAEQTPDGNLLDLALLQTGLLDQQDPDQDDPMDLTLLDQEDQDPNIQLPLLNTPDHTAQEGPPPDLIKVTNVNEDDVQVDIATEATKDIYEGLGENNLFSMNELDRSMSGISKEQAKIFRMFEHDIKKNFNFSSPQKEKTPPPFPIKLSLMGQEEDLTSLSSEEQAKTRFRIPKKNLAPPSASEELTLSSETKKKPGDCRKKQELEQELLETKKKYQETMKSKYDFLRTTHSKRRFLFFLYLH